MIPRTPLHRTALLVGLTLSVPALAPAQDGPEGSKRGEGEREVVDSDVTGRNDQLEAAFRGLAQRLSKHVLAVQSQGGSHRGYGVAIEGGYVLTASRVARGKGPFRIEGPAGRFAADLVGRDATNDLALLQPRGEGLDPIELGADSELGIGEFVVTVGTESSPLCVGVVSAKDRAVEPSEGGRRNVLMGLFSDGNKGHRRAYPSVLQHDGPLGSDHFGAPLVDREGRLVGVNVAMPYRGSSHAVGIDQVRTVLGDLKAGTIDPAKRTRPRTGDDPPETGDDGGPWLGVSGVPAPEDSLHGAYSFGLRVREVQGPAAEAGLREGDVIVEIAGTAFDSMDDLADTLYEYAPGDQVTIKVIRDSKLEELTAELGSQ